MNRFTKLSAAAIISALLAACAQNTVQSYDPPPAKRVDAKTQLERGAGGY